VSSFLLDTCTLSELTKPAPNLGVIAWVEGQDELGLHVSVLTLGELHKGIAKLPAGKRRSRLERWVTVDLATRFRGRVLDVNREVAVAWGGIQAQAERSGKPIPLVDSLIGATALVHECVVVTRNSTDIERTGVTVVDPWQ